MNTPTSFKDVKDRIGVTFRLIIGTIPQIFMRGLLWSIVAGGKAITATIRFILPGKSTVEPWKIAVAKLDNAIHGQRFNEADAILKDTVWPNADVERLARARVQQAKQEAATKARDEALAGMAEAIRTGRLSISNAVTEPTPKLTAAALNARLASKGAE